MTPIITNLPRKPRPSETRPTVDRPRVLVLPNTYPQVGDVVQTAQGIGMVVGIWLSGADPALIESYTVRLQNGKIDQFKVDEVEKI